MNSEGGDGSNSPPPPTSQANSPRPVNVMGSQPIRSGFPIRFGVLRPPPGLRPPMLRPPVTRGVLGVLGYPPPAQPQFPAMETESAAGGRVSTAGQFPVLETGHVSPVSSACVSTSSAQFPIVETGNVYSSAAAGQFPVSETGRVNAGSFTVSTPGGFPSSCLHSLMDQPCPPRANMTHEGNVHFRVTMDSRCTICLRLISVCQELESLMACHAGLQHASFTPSERLSSHENREFSNYLSLLNASHVRSGALGEVYDNVMADLSQQFRHREQHPSCVPVNPQCSGSTQNSSVTGTTSVRPNQLPQQPPGSSVTGTTSLRPNQLLQ